MILLLQPAGLGAAPPPDLSWIDKLTGSLPGAVATGAATGLSTRSVAAGSISTGLAVAAPFTGPAAPFLLAAAALVGPLSKLFGRGCGEPCKVSAYYADTGQKAAQGVMDAYFGQPVRTRSMQAQAIQVLVDIGQWQEDGWLRDPATGSEGRKYYEERTTGALSAVNQCRPESPQMPQCKFFRAFCCAIAEDPAVVDDPTIADSVASTLGLPSDVDAEFLMYAAALAAVAVMVL